MLTSEVFQKWQVDKIANHKKGINAINTNFHIILSMATAIHGC